MKFFCFVGCQLPMITNHCFKDYEGKGTIIGLKNYLQATIFQLDSVEALHANDGEEVVDEEEDDNRRSQPGNKNHGRAKHVPEPLLHPEQRQQPVRNRKMSKLKFYVKTFDHFNRLITLTSCQYSLLNCSTFQRRVR